MWLLSVRQIIVINAYTIYILSPTIDIIIIWLNWVVYKCSKALHWPINLRCKWFNEWNLGSLKILNLKLFLLDHLCQNLSWFILLIVIKIHCLNLSIAGWNRLFIIHHIWSAVIIINKELVGLSTWKVYDLVYYLTTQYSSIRFVCKLKSFSIGIDNTLILCILSICECVWIARTCIYYNIRTSINCSLLLFFLASIKCLT
jgi:hypothetical protein